jgi:putative transposase
MPRRPRIHLDGVPLHIVQRGHNRAPCFFGEEDYQTYHYWLAEALKKEHCALHAYALMTNHVHLLITPEREKHGDRSSYVALNFVGHTATPPQARRFLLESDGGCGAESHGYRSGHVLTY